MKYRVKEFREELGLSQADLAEKSGVSRAIISGLESGRTIVTTTDTLTKLSKALGKPVSEILLG